jgi:hypothetical protein
MGGQPGDLARNRFRLESSAWPSSVHHDEGRSRYLDAEQALGDEGRPR